MTLNLVEASIKCDRLKLKICTLKLLIYICDTIVTKEFPACTVRIYFAMVNHLMLRGKIKYVKFCVNIPTSILCRNSVIVSRTGFDRNLHGIAFTLGNFISLEDYKMITVWDETISEYL